VSYVVTFHSATDFDHHVSCTYLSSYLGLGPVYQAIFLHCVLIQDLLNTFNVGQFNTQSVYFRTICVGK